MRHSLASNQTEQSLIKIPRRHLPSLLSNLSTTLSWTVSALKDINGKESADSVDQILKICCALERISVQLNLLAERQVFAPNETAPPGEPHAIQRETLMNPQHQLTYCSPQMHRVVEKVERAAKQEVPILITGETGVGKELIARFIHLTSRRSRGPMIPINCAAIPKDLFESQFFGHRRGAFTGALGEQPGIIKSASGGTLFLDEIGELPLETQPKLLRFLQEGEIHTIGDNKPTKVDVRIVASTNRDLEAEVRVGRFRADLLHRLNIISFEIPALRERREDILLLLDFFLDKYSCLAESHSIRFSPDALDCLIMYSWPGNVRELSSLVLKLVSLAKELTIIFPSDLPTYISSVTTDLPDKSTGINHQSAKADQSVSISPNLKLGEAINNLERQKVADALSKNKGSYSRAARELGLSTFGLRKKYRRLFGSNWSAEPLED